MRTVIIHFCNTQDQKQSKILQNLTNGAKARGNDVELFDAQKDSLDSLHLLKYEYIAIALPATQFIGATVPKKLFDIFASCGSVSGKKGCVVVLKAGLSSKKLVHRVMHECESQGMVLDYFEIISSIEHSLAVSKNIG